MCTMSFETNLGPESGGKSLIASAQSAVCQKGPGRGKRRKIYRPKHGIGSTWKKKIKKMYSGYNYRQLQQGPWDPYTFFPTNEKVRTFFNGFEMPLGGDKVHYRERFAIWAINEALKDYPISYFHGSCQAFRNETIQYQIGSNIKPLPTAVTDAIRADGQHDVDAEVGNPMFL